MWSRTREDGQWPCAAALSIQPEQTHIRCSQNTHYYYVFSIWDVLVGCCRRSHQSLQRYEKTDNHMLVCPNCPQSPLARNSRSQEHCARKCKKVKKNFSCRWVTVCFCVSLKPSTGFPHAHVLRLTPPLLLCIYIFLLFIICSSLNYFLCASTQGFQLSKAQQEMPLASLWPFHPRCAEAGQRQLYSVWKKR